MRQRIAICEEVDLLVRRAQETTAGRLRAIISACDEDIDLLENARPEEVILDLVQGITSEYKPTKASTVQAMEKIEQGFGLLEGFAAGDGKPLYLVIQVEDGGGNLSGVGPVAAVRVMGPRVEAAGASQRAALEPEDGTKAGPVGSAGRLEGVQADIHSADSKTVTVHGLLLKENETF
ncbi:MAG: hypothetical protein R6U98_14900 [Pirellulaceae bacterium]